MLINDNQVIINKTRSSSEQLPLIQHHILRMYMLDSMQITMNQYCSHKQQ